jgi:DNA-binding MarR family transcriptional regulator
MRENPSALIHDRLREVLVYLEFEDERLLAPFDLAPAHFSALRILRDTGGLRMGDLGDRLLVDKSKVTRIVDHLEARGWANRSADPADRRATRVVLTAAGEAHLAHVDARREAELPDRLARLNAEEQAALAGMLTDLRDHLIQRLTPTAKDTP